MADPHLLEARLRPLWLRAQAGDEVAYREALLLAAARLRSYIARRSGAQADEVEDLVQETLMALHQQRGTYDPALPVSAWMFAIARHKLIDALRRQGRSRRLFEPLDELPEDLQPATLPPSGAARDLQRLLATLPTAQARCIGLTKLQGHSLEEVAQGLGLSVASVKVNVHRGLKRLNLLIGGRA